MPAKVEVRKSSDGLLFLDTGRIMSPTTTTRLLGLAIIVIVALSIYALDKSGIVNLMESIANVVFLVIGGLVTVALGLLLFPERFLGPAKSGTVKLKDTEKVKILPELTQADDVEKIEGIQIYLFFPDGTPEKVNSREAVDYHAKNLRYKLIVNFKTKPWEAWYMSHPASYGWRLLDKYPDIYTKEWYPAGTKTEDEQVTAKWCKKKKITLIPKDAERQDLLRSS